MHYRLGTYWRIFWACRRIYFMCMLEYRTDFFFWAFISTMWTVFNIFFLVIIAQAGGAVAGWSLPEVYVLTALFTLLDAFTWSFFYQNMSAYTNAVFTGDLSKYLTRPIDPQFMLMTEGNNYNNIFRFLIGAVMLIWAIPQLASPPNLLQIMTMILLLIIAFSFIYFLWFIFSTFSFWVDRLQNINEIIPNVRRVFQVPAPVFTGGLSFVLTVVLPLSLVTTLPSEVLFGRANTWLLLYFTFFTLAVMIFSRWFFFFSLKKFTGSAN